MEKKELLGALSELTGKYEQHRSYIEKAQVQAASGKFKKETIEKVIRDHEAKSSDVAGHVEPLLPELAGFTSGLDAEKKQIEDSRGGVDEQIGEFELRCAIGELSDEDFEKEVKDLKENQAAANARIETIDAELAELNGALQRWADLASPHGHYTAPAAPAPEEPSTPVSEEESFEGSEPIFADVLMGEPAIDVDKDGSHVTRTEIRDDVSAVFGEIEGNGQAIVRVSSSLEEEIAIETAEVNEDLADGPSADVQFGFEDEILGGDGAAGGEVEIDLAGEVIHMAESVDEVQPETAAEPAVEGNGAADEQPRRALLLYQEGTAEEQIYPFTGDTLTIGRGRENDIQIKNDSKVSRYHCKIFRRGNNFYIEDQKSSNGSLVNGELITDRRLFGGEEIVIGETFFRFRIME